MTTIPPMIRARVDGIPGLAANGHTGQQSEMGDQSDAKGQVPLQTSAEFIRTYNAQAHEIVDAITAAVTNAEAGLNWLRAQPLNLEGVEQALNNIANDGKRVCELVAQLRAAMKVPTQQGAPDS